MKNKIFLLVFILFSKVSFAQKLYKSDSALSRLQSQARAMESIGNIESAFYLYGTIKDRDSSSAFGIDAVKKMDSLQPFLQQNVIDKLIGTWKLRKLCSEDSAQKVFTEEIKFSQRTVYFYNYKKGKKILFKSCPVRLLPFGIEFNSTIDLGNLGKWQLILKKTNNDELGNKFGLFNETRLLVLKEGTFFISIVDSMKPEFKKKNPSKMKNQPSSESATYYVKIK